MNPIAPANSTVFVVDDDPSVREAIKNLLDSVGVEAQTFESAEEFYNAPRPDVPSCLLLDVRLPGVNGLELQEQLTKAGMFMQVVFITAHGDVPMTSRAMKAGAIEFLMKPFQKEDLLTAIRRGLERDRIERQARADLSLLRSRFEQLTQREKEVMGLVVAGIINKEIGAKLGLSEVTVKVHRARVMQKMQAASLAELVRISDKLSSSPGR